MCATVSEVTQYLILYSESNHQWLIPAYRTYLHVCTVKMGNLYNEAHNEAKGWDINANLTRSIDLIHDQGDRNHIYSNQRLPPVIKQAKDERDTDSFLDLIGPHQCGILMVITG